MYLCNQHTSQMKKLRGFFSGSVKKRWTIINNNVAINYGVHYLLRSVTSLYKNYKLLRKQLLPN